MKRFLKASLSGEDLSDSEDIPRRTPIINPPKKNLKAAFLNDEDSDDDTKNHNHVVLPSRGQDVDGSDVVKALSSWQTQSSPVFLSSGSNSQGTKCPPTFGSPAFDYDNFYRPAFEKDFMRPDEPIVLSDAVDDNDNTHQSIQVNRYTARYLIDHQVIGVQWLYSKYEASEGAILGDDMGMGKTVQIAALLSAVFDKTGTEDDQDRNKRKKRGQMLPSDGSLLAPVLVICPKSIVDNWSLELNRWGYFLLDNLTSAKDESVADDIISRAAAKRTEIVLISYSTLVKFHERLSTIRWSMLVLDEGHTLKNETSNVYKYVSSIKRAKCRILLTGTPVQNDLRELWAILSLIHNGNFMEKNEFITSIEKPIKLGMSSASDKTAEKHAAVARNKLTKTLDKCLLGRKKDTLTGEHALKDKHEIIVFCGLTPLQQRMYEDCLASPDFDNVRYCSSRTVEHGGERENLPIQFIKPYDREILETAKQEVLDARAVLWRQQHANDEACGNCPFCMSLACLSRLSKIANHPVLLQADCASMSLEKQRKAEEFLQAVFTPQTVAELGGVQRSTQFMVRQSTETSGKMKTLMEMLRFFVSVGEKSLIFSISTQVLDLLQAMIIAQGWRHLRLDGQTLSTKRQKLVDEFNTVAHGLPMIFLISSRAGGLGLNLNTATKVIIFDVDWNPTVDMQSQDRAYRIGQKESVAVYRLVAKGTVEELAYMRQLYKQQLQRAVLPWERQKQQAAQTASSKSKSFEKGQFQGVEGEISMRGELFGIQNLFQFSRHSILTALRDRFAAASGGAAGAGGGAVKKRQLPQTFANQRAGDEDERMLSTEGLGDIIMQFAADPTPLLADGEKAEGGGGGGDNDAMALLQNIGFDLHNVHKNDDLLKHRATAAASSSTQASSSSSSSTARRQQQQSAVDEDDEILMDVDEEEQRMLLGQLEKQKQQQVERAKQHRLLAQGRPPLPRKRPVEDSEGGLQKKKGRGNSSAAAAGGEGVIRRPINRLQSMEEKDGEGDDQPQATLKRIPAHKIETQLLPDYDFDFALAPAPAPQQAPTPRPAADAGGNRRQLPATLASSAVSRGYYKPSYT